MIRILNPEENIKMYQKTLGLEAFSKIQTFFRINFKEKIGSKRSYDALTNHYGSKENADEKIFDICKNLMEYEMHLHRHFLNKKEVSVFMKNFEEQMAVFGIEPVELRSVYTMHHLRMSITYNTVDWS